MRHFFIALSSAIAASLLATAVAIYFEHLNMPRIALAQLAEANTWQYIYHNTRLMEFLSWVLGASFASALLAAHRARKLNKLQEQLYEAAVDAQTTRAQMENRL